MIACGLWWEDELTRDPRQAHGVAQTPFAGPTNPMPKDMMGTKGAAHGQWAPKAQPVRFEHWQPEDVTPHRDAGRHPGLVWFEPLPPASFKYPAAVDKSAGDEVETYPPQIYVAGLEDLVRGIAML